MLPVLKQRRDALIAKRDWTAEKYRRADESRRMEYIAKLCEIRSRLLVYGEIDAIFKNVDAATRETLSAIFAGINVDGVEAVKNHLSKIIDAAEKMGSEISTAENVSEFDREMMMKQSDAIRAETDFALELLSGGGGEE